MWYIEVDDSHLHWTCLVESYSSISAMILTLADKYNNWVLLRALMPLCMTIFKILSSILVEQGHYSMSKVQSGTFAVLYKLLNAHAKDMDIGPMTANLMHSSNLILSDLCMTSIAKQSYASQMAVTIVYILTKYVQGF